MICEYCGEEEATTKIANPDLDMGSDIDWNDSKSWWQVCQDCKEVIHLQSSLSIAEYMGDEKRVKDCMKKIQEISKRSGKPVICATISKQKDGSLQSESIEFTGE